ncbi:MAG: ParA family protein, partial [Candidatus Brocadiia bacterium]
MRTIAVANQKGGCGKTTTAVNVSAALGSLGKKVLTIDLDPQGHATLGFGVDPESLDKTVYDTLTSSRLPLSRVIVSSTSPGVNLATANILLSGAEFELASLYGREY